MIPQKDFHQEGWKRMYYDSERVIFVTVWNRLPMASRPDHCRDVIPINENEYNP